MGRRQIPSRGGSIFTAVQGHATLIHDKSSFAEHWVSSLDRWFPEGIDAVSMILIKVHAARIRYRDGEDNGEIPLRAPGLRAGENFSEARPQARRCCNFQQIAIRIAEIHTMAAALPIGRTFNRDTCSDQMRAPFGQAFVRGGKCDV